MMNKKDEHLFS